MCIRDRQCGHNRTSEKKTEEIMKQIRMIPKYKSHYRREQCDAEYLPPGMTLQQWRLVKKIHMRFLVSGHSFLPNDADFSDIETALKHQQ